MSTFAGRSGKGESRIPAPVAVSLPRPVGRMHRGAATERLVRAANENGGYDNISVILLEAVDAAAQRVRPGPTREFRLP